MEKVVRTSLKNDFPMVRKQAVATFSLLVLRCQCALSGIAFKDEAYESQRGRAEQIQETMTKCREVIRCVAESLNDPDVRVVAECCKSLYMLIEENNTHIYSRVDEGFNFHTSEEAKEVEFIFVSHADPDHLSFPRVGFGARGCRASPGSDLLHREPHQAVQGFGGFLYDRGHLGGVVAGLALQ